MPSAGFCPVSMCLRVCSHLARGRPRAHFGRPHLTLLPGTIVAPCTLRPLLLACPGTGRPLAPSTCVRSRGGPSLALAQWHWRVDPGPPRDCVPPGAEFPRAPAFGGLRPPAPPQATQASCSSNLSLQILDQRSSRSNCWK